jgi:hypothetical protein
VSAISEEDKTCGSWNVSRGQFIEFSLGFDLRVGRTQMTANGPRVTPY